MRNQRFSFVKGMTLLIPGTHFKERLSIKFLDHATDALIEITASNLKEAFTLAGQSVVDTTFDRSTIEEKEQKTLSVSGKDLRYLLLNWLEEINFYLITKGFAIRRFELDMKKNDEYQITANVFGEPIDLGKHNFKVEIKSPTFHLMDIKQEEKVTLRFLLDL